MLDIFSGNIHHIIGINNFKLYEARAKMDRPDERSKLHGIHFYYETSYTGCDKGAVSVGG